ncbi:MAG: hypothetical protein JWO44_1939 [Bacteroidetes bacterium]|nr:hypothetical protein [Bacteroidota bacterium]
MLASNVKSPGVYITEMNAFPNSVVPVATAVPAFIGYTPQALYEGKSYTNVPFKISSFAEFQAIFCYQPPASQGSAPQAPTPQQYSPQYYLVPSKTQPASGDYMQFGSTYYSILPDPNSVYYMYNSIRLFYDNGGADAYIVSVGSYGENSGKPMNLGDPLVNPNVDVNQLKYGLALLKNEVEPTMYICPEATLLSVANNGNLMQAMLLQCSTMQTAISIFDVIGGNAPDPFLYIDDITTFRENTGSIGLEYGTAYYPFIGTSLMQTSDIDYTNFFGNNPSQLASVLSPADNPDSNITSIMASISAGTLTVLQNNNALINASQTYQQILKHVLADANTLPPSAAMAGIMTTIDNQDGVWQAPANVSIADSATLPIRLSESQQENLNMDAVSGKSINAIRSFNGIGILVWGARTLDGNSQDWKYLPVRRTMIFLEQSCKLAAQAYVFQPNNKNTWEAVKAMIGSFLTSIWKEGGLFGPTAATAFSVDCGLGTTMTNDDILNGFMNVTVKVALVRPAEFIMLTFQQQMPASS